MLERNNWTNLTKAYVDIVSESEFADADSGDPIIEGPMQVGGVDQRSAGAVNDKLALSMIAKALHKADEHPEVSRALKVVNEYVTQAVGKALTNSSKRFHRNYRDYHTDIEYIVYSLCTTFKANDVADGNEP